MLHVTPPRRAALALAFFLVAAHAVPAAAQITGSNLFLGQVGNWPPSIPDRGSPNRESFYDQVNLAYLFGSSLVGLRYETDQNSDAQFEYRGFSQRFVDLSDQGYRLRVGNFYTILGRGIVHRSFELTGVILEKTGIRTRLAPSRDVDGVLAEVERGPMSLRLMGGSPSEGFTSLAEEQADPDRPAHRGHIAGGQLALAGPRDAKIGATYLRSTGGVTSTGLPGQHETGSGFVEIDPLRVAGIEGVALPVYAEYAASDRPLERAITLNTADRTAHALYVGSNLLWGPLGVSAEWKDYSLFRLGTNDPPTAIKEHSTVLLNRVTHVLDANAEEGYQLEATVTPFDWASVALNKTRADGRRADRFEEAYAELHVTPDNAARWEATAFYDAAYDSFTSITDRDTYGVLATVRFLSRWSASLDAERQTADRIGFTDATFTNIGIVPFENVYVTLTGALADRGSLGFTWERTTDQLDRSWEFGRTKPLHLVGWTLNARLAERHDATLFVGKRRGGLACTAGTCYEVQPFEGVELRVVSRF